MNTAEVPLRQLIERCLTEIAKLKGRVGDLEADFYEDEPDDDQTLPVSRDFPASGKIQPLDLAALPEPSEDDLARYLREVP